MSEILVEFIRMKPMQCAKKVECCSAYEDDGSLSRTVKDFSQEACSKPRHWSKVIGSSTNQIKTVSGNKSRHVSFL